MRGAGAGAGGAGCGCRGCGVRGAGSADAQGQRAMPPPHTTRRGPAAVPVFVEVKRKPRQDESEERDKDGGGHRPAARALVLVRGVLIRAQGIWKTRGGGGCRHRTHSDTQHAGASRVGPARRQESRLPKPAPSPQAGPIGLTVRGQDTTP